jgi:glyoxylase-like metal-dependent hydrolase (beta-lactamase superfamily II)
LPYFLVGDIKVYPLREFDVFFPPQVFFPQSESDPLDSGAWYAQPPHQLDGRIRLNQQSHLLDTPAGWVLIDAAAGNEKVRPSDSFHNQHRRWLDQLALLGLEAKDIASVLFTHLHCDHVGFATDLGEDGSWQATFPQARYVLARPEWDWWTSRAAIDPLRRTGDHISDSIRPLGPLGVLDLVDADARITDAIRFIPAFGHTPGNITIEVKSAGHTALFVGDLIHNALQLARPTWSTRFCIEPERAAASRVALLEQVADTDTIVVPEHFPAPSGIRVLRDGQGAYRYRFVEAVGDVNATPDPTRW